MSSYHLAQVNIARLQVPEGDPQVADFFDNIDRINALGENHPGFIWRFEGDYEDDPMVVFNMSIWESIEQLASFAYRSAHIDIYRRRGEWFEELDGAHMAMWWKKKEAPAPTIEEAFARLRTLDENGPTIEAFTFKQTFAAPDAVQARQAAGHT